MNTRASHQTRKARVVLAGLPVRINTMRQFRDTCVAADELETITTAAARLAAAGFTINAAPSKLSTGWHIYAVQP